MLKNYYVEKYHPYVLSVVLGVIFYLVQPFLSGIQELMGKLTDATVIVSATFIGFFLTITTILNTINTRRMRFVKDQDGMKSVKIYLHNAIFLNLIALVISIIIPFVYKMICPGYQPYFYSFQIVIISCSWFSSIRFSYIFLKLMGGEE